MFYSRIETERVGEIEKVVEHDFTGSLEEIQEVIEQFHQQELEKEIECCGAPTNITLNGDFVHPLSKKDEDDFLEALFGLNVKATPLKFNF